MPFHEGDIENDSRQRAGTQSVNSDSYHPPSHMADDRALVTEFQSSSRSHRADYRHPHSRDRSRSPRGGYRGPKHRDFYAGHPAAYDRHDRHEPHNRSVSPPYRQYRRRDYEYSRSGSRGGDDVLHYEEIHVTEVDEPPRAKGDEDVSPDNTPSQFLLVRDLNPSTTEEVFAKGMMKLFKGTETTAASGFGAPEGSLRRVLLVRAKKTNASRGYGFAEYFSAEDAKAAFEAFNALDKFTISSRPLQLDYPHAGIFRPPDRRDGPNPRTVSHTNTPGNEFVYRDPDAYITEYVVSTQMPSNNLPDRDPPSNSSNRETSALEKKIKKKEVAVQGAANSLFDRWGAASAKIRGKSYVHGLGCYLCRRHFQTEETLKAHMQKSQLHLTNLQDEKKKADAVAAVAKLEDEQSAALPKKASSAGEASQYRDRAKERRQLHKPAGKPKATTAVEEEQAAAKPSIGVNILSKMGWQEGKGLGAAGEGMADVIQPNAYASGVGLGAVGSNLGDAVEQANANTKGGGKDFSAKTWDNARERFNAL